MSLPIKIIDGPSKESLSLGLFHSNNLKDDGLCEFAFSSVSGSFSETAIFSVLSVERNGDHCDCWIIKAKSILHGIEVLIHFNTQTRNGRIKHEFAESEMTEMDFINQIA